MRIGAIIAASKHNGMIYLQGPKASVDFGRFLLPLAVVVEGVSATLASGEVEQVEAALTSDSDLAY